MARARDEERFDLQRVRILDAAAEQFATAGFEATTMGAIAEHVGLTKPALYYYFPSKLELLRRICERVVAAALADLLPDDDADYGAQLERMVTGHLRLLAENLDAFTLLFTQRELVAGPEGGHLQDLLHTFTKRLEEFIAAGVRAGTFRTVDPRLSALAIIGMLNWSHRWLRTEPHGVDEVSAAFTDLVRAALLR